MVRSSPSLLRKRCTLRGPSRTEVHCRRQRLIAAMGPSPSVNGSLHIADFRLQGTANSPVPHHRM
ncbi:hypothetical protein [[Eubacterium] cellulosolvens]